MKESQNSKIKSPRGTYLFSALFSSFQPPTTSRVFSHFFHLLRQLFKTDYFGFIDLFIKMNSLQQEYSRLNYPIHGRLLWKKKVTYTHIHTHRHITDIEIHIHVHTHIYNTHIYIQMCTYINTIDLIHTCIQDMGHIYTYRMYRGSPSYIYFPYMCTYIHTRTHTQTSSPKASSHSICEVFMTLYQLRNLNNESVSSNDICRSIYSHRFH